MNSDRIKDLVTTLNFYSNAYHVNDNEIVPDSVYDNLYAELLDLEGKYPDSVLPYSPTQRVGERVSGALEKVSHVKRMLSLNNAFTRQDMDKTIGQLNLTSGIVAELKLDGLAVSLIYRNGVLVAAVTRGDSFTGDSILHTVKTMRSVPLYLDTPEVAGVDSLLEVRGEIVMPFKGFEQHNDYLESIGEQRKVNPRNAAAGAVRKHDPKEAAKAPVEFRAYTVARSELIDLPDTHMGTLTYLNELGFLTSPMARLCHSIDECEAFYKEVITLRSTLPMAIDGVVYKINSINEQNELGEVNRYPRWATAWKFPAEEVTSTIENVIFQVSKSGCITPVAKIKPVVIDGSTISSATLFNQSHINKYGFCLGDTVIVIKAGDVIPKITSRIDSLCNPSNTPIVIPDRCPCCDSPVVNPPNEANFYCTGGDKCSAQTIRTFQRYVSQKAMNITSLGDKKIECLLDGGFLKTLGDIYRLNTHYDTLVQLDGFGETSIDKIIQATEKAKATTLPKFLYSLGIKDIGETASLILANHFLSFDGIRNATYEQLVAIDGIGNEYATNLVSFFKSEAGQALINDLVDAGVNWPDIEPKLESELPLKGATFVATGTFSVFSRGEIEKTIKALGGKVSGSVSSKTTAVFVGEKAGSKLEKAKSLNLSIYTDEDIKSGTEAANADLSEYLSALAV